MQLIVIHGPPAVGKLTVAKKLCELTGLPLFHNHLTVDLVMSVFPFGSAGFVELREHIWLQVMGAAAADNRSLVFTFNPEATVTAGFVDALVATIEDAGGRVVFVELTAPEDVIEARMDSPSRSAYGKLQSAVLYRKLRGENAFAYPALAQDLRIDTSTTDPPQAAEQIEAFIGPA